MKNLKDTSTQTETKTALPTHIQKLTKKGQATRARIVAAAAKLMYERGVAGTSVEDVQQEAGVSSSQLYHYFKEKRELVLAVILFQNELVLGSQEPLLSHLDSMEALQSWRDAHVQYQTEQGFQGGCPIGSLGNELADLEPAARKEVAAGFMQWELAIRQGLRAMYDRGEMRSDAQPERLALGLLAALQGGLLLAKVRKEAGPIEAGLDVMLDHIRSFLIETSPE
ncbi:TetR/AcrR family transcriptional regulator [Paenibacillus sp. XY044]|uniref:TetR/AcrR family transcriptional regulator n=1 Tax=Paenibacillus sp. XY044 TaxID=2026089 RepID=UPI000B984EAB|nr:TetR/AcrR family transcriptional regulator [Paenibacillus sp. XY044]OZB92460.1 TetR family transcriptional regulator [Paenibacillus sp. XY044]